MEAIYYRLVHEKKGHHYFKVLSNQEDVIKITFGNQPKRGGVDPSGITLLKYCTFISSYGWNLSRRSDHHELYMSKMQVITKKEYDLAFRIITKKLRDYGENKDRTTVTEAR